MSLPSPVYYTATCQIDSKQKAAVAHRELISVLCDDLEGWDGGDGWEAPEGADVCLH